MYEVVLFSLSPNLYTNKSTFKPRVATLTLLLSILHSSCCFALRRLILVQFINVDPGLAFNVTKHLSW